MKPTRCTLLLSIFISTSLHVSGNYVPIIRRTYCFCATLVFFTLYGWLAGLLVGMGLQSHPNQQTRQPPDCSPIPTNRSDSHQTAAPSQPTDQTATRLQSHPNQLIRQPPDCSPIPTNRSDSHHTAVPSQPTDQTATRLQSHPNQQIRQSPIWSEKYQCRTDTVSSFDDVHIVTRNMYRS